MNMNLIHVNNYEFGLIKELVYREAGIYLKESKKALVSNRLRKRVYKLGFSNYKRYYNYITRAPEGRKELAHFIDALTINETFFFRNPKQFDFLEKNILPEIIEKKKNSICRDIKIWSAACSTGEEPYSIAILMREKLPQFDKWKVQIMAVDINQNVIKQAKQAIYRQYAVDKMPKYYIRKYFTIDKVNKNYILKNEIKKMVTFYNHNLLAPFLFGNFDMVFCRNVMIYFNDESKISVYENIADSMRKNGYLIIGYSESMMRTDLGLFKYIQPTIYQKI